MKYWKSAQGKKLIDKRYKAAFLIAFLMILGSPTYALSYDLQPYTSCSYGICTTSVDMSSLGLSTQKINNIKSMNITNFLNKTGIIYDFSYTWNGNTITLTGKVKENVYWSFGAGQDKFDPWWNYTSSGYRANDSSNIVLLVPFDEIAGSTANDYSPFKQNLTLYGTATFQTGFYSDYSLNLTTTGAYANTSTTEALSPTSAITLMAWIYIDPSASTAATHKIICKGAQSTWASPYADYCMELTPTGYKISGFVNTATNEVAGSASLAASKWYHVAFVYNGTHEIVYVNGTINATKAVTGTINVNGKPLSIGTRHSWDNGDYFAGKIDEVKIFNTSLTTAQIIAEMNTPIKYSTNVSTWYETDLWLNGAQSNITLSYPNPLNITAYNNLTLNSSIYINGTLKNNTPTLASYITTLGAGFYNITGVYFNQTAGLTSSLTYYATINKASNPLNLSVNVSNNTVCSGFAVNISCSGTSVNLYNNTSAVANPLEFIPPYNMTYTCNSTGDANTSSNTTNFTLEVYVCPAPNTTAAEIGFSISIDLNNAPLTCYNTSHAVRNTTFYNNGSAIPLAELYRCPYGCDNNTNSGCNPPQYQASLIILGIVAFILIVMYKVYKWI